jgi:hypothetical protein
VPTIVRYSPELAARFRLQSGEWQYIQPSDLEEYVSEEKNSENRKGVTAIEVVIVYLCSPRKWDSCCKLLHDYLKLWSICA